MQIWFINCKAIYIEINDISSEYNLNANFQVFIRVCWQKVLKREQVSNPFWLEAISRTELPNGLKLVQQTIAQSEH